MEVHSCLQKEVDPIMFGKQVLLGHKFKKNCNVKKTILEFGPFLIQLLLCLMYKERLF